MANETIKKFLSSTMEVEKLIKSIDGGKFGSDLPWQRTEGLLTNYQASLLIDTILNGYMIPAIWVTKTATETFNKNSVIDGVQRTSTLYRFVTNKFKLHRDIKPVTITVKNEDGTTTTTTYDIAGKKFSKLPEYLQNIVLDYDLSVIEVLGFTDEEIEEQFYRLNSCATFTKYHKLKVILGAELAEKINAVEALPFWNRTGFSTAQRKGNKITAVILQCLMLLTGYEFSGFGINDVERFSEWYADNYNEQDIKYLSELLTKLDNCMLDTDENTKFLKAVNIPALVMNVDKFLSLEDSDFTEDDYTKFLNDWIDHNAERSGYMDNCGAHSTNIVKVNSRVEIMDKWLADYVRDKTAPAAPTDDKNTREYIDGMFKEMTANTSTKAS